MSNVVRRFMDVETVRNFVHQTAECRPYFASHVNPRNRESEVKNKGAWTNLTKVVRDHVIIHDATVTHAPRSLSRIRGPPFFLSADSRADCKAGMVYSSLPANRGEMEGNGMHYAKATFLFRDPQIS